MSRRAFSAAVLATLLVAGASARAARFEYLYVESNVGGSSGGHAAVRFGDRVFHYQNANDGSLRLLRERFDAFRYAYTVLENRSVHVGRVDVSDASYEQIHDHFNRRFLIEQQHFEQLEARRSDVALLERILGRVGNADLAARPADEPKLRGAGFFESSDSASVASAPALVELRDRIQQRHGPDALGRRLAATDRSIAELRPGKMPIDSPISDRDRLPGDEYAFSERFSDLASGRAALDVLITARPVRREVLRSDSTPDWRLSQAERDVLRSYEGRLEDRLVDLFGSERDDWGFVALVGMARLEAIAESLATGRWVVLDAFPARSRAITDVAHPGRSEFFAELRRFARTDFFDTRAALLAADEIGERDYNEVEAAANRALEVRDGLASGRDIRVYGGRLVPHGEQSPPDAWLPRMSPAEASSALGIARARESSTVQALRAIYGYELVTNNCVSALFQTLESAFEPSEVAERLGGRVETNGTLNFIPWVSFDAMTREYRVAEVGEIPSLRMTRMSEMYARENRAKVYLRESNTLTSSVYRNNPRDSFFLFFTDDVVLPRPLYGALNLVAGLGQAVLGLLRLPFEGPDEVVAGAKGAFFSLPELFFVNLRKGSLDYGPSMVARTGLESSGPAD